MSRNKSRHTTIREFIIRIEPQNGVARTFPDEGDGRYVGGLYEARQFLRWCQDEGTEVKVFRGMTILDELDDL